MVTKKSIYKLCLTVVLVTSSLFESNAFSTPSFGCVKGFKSRGGVSLHQEYDNWKVGDVESDLQELRLAVRENRAKSDLEQRNRLDLLNEFARQRRELIPDIRNFVFRPLLMALTFSVISLRVTWKPYVVQRTFLRFLGVMNTSFWVVSVICPLLLYFAKIWIKEQEQDSSHFAQNDLFPLDWKTFSYFEEGDLSFLDWIQDDWKGRGVCSDYNLCLLENWASSVFASAILGLTLIMSRLQVYGTRVSWSISVISDIRWWKFGAYFSQLLTRLGAASSIYQYPGLLYELKRTNQPRPIAFFPSVMQKLVRACIWILPFGFTCDLAQCIVLIFRVKECGGLVPSTTSRHVMATIKIIMMHISLLFSVIPPLIHLYALKKLFRIQYFTNMSLSTEVSTAEELLKNPVTARWKWRYKLNWREPRRLSQAIKVMRRDVLRFVLSLLGNDIEAAIKRKLELKDILDIKESEPKILDLVGEDMNRNPTVKKPNRKTWVPSSLAKMEDIHQTNYEKKNFEDPLGIAVQQTLGIGLSFDFDHDTKLKKGENPSIHRLRARAAKSAVKRFNQIKKERKEHIDRTEDARERVKEERRMAELSKQEILYLRNELLELIPTNAASPEGKHLDIETLRQSDALKLNVPIPNSDKFIESQEKPNSWKTRYNDADLVDNAYFKEDELFVKEFMKKNSNKADNVDDIDVNFLDEDNTYLA